ELRDETSAQANGRCHRSAVSVGVAQQGPTRAVLFVSTYTDALTARVGDLGAPLSGWESPQGGRTSRSPPFTAGGALGLQPACTARCLLRQPPRGLHALDAVAGEVAPDDGVAHQLVGARLDDARVSMELQVELAHLLDDVGREIHA